MSGVDSRLRGNDEVNAACRGWIPAFAGMTRLTRHVGGGFPPSRE